MAKIERLKARRSQLADNRNDVNSRALYGESIAGKFREATGYDVPLDSFDTNVKPPVVFSAPTMEQASDWALLNVDEEAALIALERLERCMTSHEGLIGIQGNTHLGLHRSASISLAGLLKVAAALDDTVVFFPDSCRAAIVVDCYRHSSMRSFYSIYVKGNEVVDCLGKS
ncbi:hypothetical protein [Luteibacter sp. 621]|uniref:hypothetical protein n=1 Tax=Luteibacter sp. 621 TaxID=3373916 RepID=UPI003D24C1DF